MERLPASTLTEAVEPVFTVPDKVPDAVSVRGLPGTGGLGV